MTRSTGPEGFWEMSLKGRGRVLESRWAIRDIASVLGYTPDVSSQRMAGFDRKTYEEYMSSEAWTRVRERAIQAAGGVCRVCDCLAMPPEVHHETYERLGRELDSDLRAVCRPCHKGIHVLVDYGRAALPSAATDYAGMLSTYRKTHLDAEYFDDTDRLRAEQRSAKEFADIGLRELLDETVDSWFLDLEARRQRARDERPGTPQAEPKPFCTRCRCFHATSERCLARVAR